MGFCLLSLWGCGQGKDGAEAPSVDESVPQSYMNDKPFLEKLKSQKKSRQALMQLHMEARRAYEEALKTDPKGEKPETKSLKMKVEEYEREYQSLRQETMKTVRDRLTSEKKSK